jgi:hypothetical protein
MSKFSTPLATVLAATRSTSATACVSAAYPRSGSHDRPTSATCQCRTSLSPSTVGPKRSRTRTVEIAAIRVEASRDDAEHLALALPGADIPIAPTHWSFGHLAGLVGAPTAYLRQLPAPLAGINLQYGLTSYRAEQVKTLEIEDGRAELRAVTGPDYGRILDHELVSAVQCIAGNGTGDTRWKVPGVLDWSTGIYNPRVDITHDTTTLYASDRDFFLFLVDDLNPIEAGRLPDGSPDLYFRGFYCWNSEVGAKTLGMASFYLRAVCQNRNLWGVEDFEEITIRHSKYAASRFAHEAVPALTRFANSSPQPFVNGIKAARERIVARTDDDRSEFLHKRRFSKTETAKIIETVLTEEGRKPESVFDFVQGITAVARDKTHQDARLDLEARAKKLLDRAALLPQSRRCGTSYLRLCSLPPFLIVGFAALPSEETLGAFWSSCRCSAGTKLSPIVTNYPSVAGDNNDDSKDGGNSGDNMDDSSDGNSGGSDSRDGSIGDNTDGCSGDNKYDSSKDGIRSRRHNHSPSDGNLRKVLGPILGRSPWLRVQYLKALWQSEGTASRGREPWLEPTARVLTQARTFAWLTFLTRRLLSTP